MTTVTNDPDFRPTPALFSYGFRPFFFGAALWATVGMALWVGMLTGPLIVPSTFDPVTWHAHAFLFGYLGAVIAGFLLTAVPNWTGRAPMIGWPLACLFGVWVAGRVAGLISAHLPLWSVMALDLAFPVLLALAMARDIIAARNWRNLPVIGLLCVFTLAHGLFYASVAGGGDPVHGIGLRMGLSAGVMLITLIGGRIVPAFTRNWLSRRGAARLPTPPERSFDWVALAALAGALVLWTIWPAGWATAIGLILAGLLHLIRLARWQGLQTRAEPLVWVLHAGYAFVPLGALTEALAILWPRTVGTAVAQHLWMAGAIGLMTLAVMSRATLGHTGQPLRAGPGTAALYLCLIGSVTARMAAGAWSAAAQPALMASALLWIAAFGGFALIYGPLVLRPRAEP